MQSGCQVNEFSITGGVKKEETWLFVEDDGKKVRHQWMTLEIPLTQCATFPGDSRICGA